MIVKPGVILQFRYENSGPDERRLGKVIAIRDTHEKPIQSKSLDANPFAPRSRYLIRCLMSDGTYRQFYHAGLTEVEPIGKIKRLALYLSGIRFDGPTKPQRNKTHKIRQSWPRISDGCIVPGSLET